MKKATIISALCALFIGHAAMAQTDGEVTYTEDPSQGYLFNKFSDNWFVTAEGGVNMEFNQNQDKFDFAKRLGPAASVYVGKWFSPLLGVRLGVNWMNTRNLSQVDVFAHNPAVTHDGLYEQRFHQIGPVADVMLNITNWWCGYKPNRFYNFILYGGGGGYFSFAKDFDENGKDLGYKSTHDRVLTVRAGIINSFNITPQFALALDLRYSASDSHRRFESSVNNRTCNIVQAYLTATYLFKKRVWNAPVVPVCPPAEDCNPLREDLADAQARIGELEHQLDACLRRPAPERIVETVETESSMATIYFPIGVSKLSSQDQNVLCAVAEVMKQNPTEKYVVTGWADNYTGTDAINTRLRHERADNAAAQLKKCGVPEGQFRVTINSGNLSPLGEKFVALDRAVTIDKDK